METKEPNWSYAHKQQIENSMENKSTECTNRRGVDVWSDHNLTVASQTETTENKTRRKKESILWHKTARKLSHQGKLSLEFKKIALVPKQNSKEMTLADFN